MANAMPRWDEHTPELPPYLDGEDTPPPLTPEEQERLDAELDRLGPVEHPDDGDDEGRKSQKDRLADLAVETYDLVVDSTGAPFAVPKDGPNIARPLRGGRRSLRAELASMYRQTYKSVPSSNALADSMMVLEGIAADSDPVDIHLRVARHGDGVIVDSGHSDGHVYMITAAGWVRMKRSPVLFRRTELINGLPDPAVDGDLDLLRELVNVADEDWPLIVGFMVASLFPGVPCPILAPRGEQGTGKTTLAKMICGVVDPSAAPVRPAPRDVEQWAVTASAGWLIALDNISTIREWLSDALCRAVTGDALPRRRLYSDDSITVVTVQRPLILTSIELGSLHGDLAERLLPVDLGRIGESARREEATLWAEYEKRLPGIVGGLYDLAAKVLAEMPHTRPDVLPRMADFGRFLAALDEVTGWDSLERYKVVAGDAFQVVIDSDLVASRIVELVEKVGSIEGTATEILTRLEEGFPDGRRPKGWPQSPHALSMQLTRTAVALRHQGIEIERWQSNGQRKVKIMAIPASLASLNRENGSTARVSAVTHPSDAPVTQVTHSDAPVTHPKQPASLPETAQPQGFPPDSDASDALSQDILTPNCEVCDQPGDLEVIRGELMHRRCRPASWLDPKEIAP